MRSRLGASKDSINPHRKIAIGRSKSLFRSRSLSINPPPPRSSSTNPTAGQAPSQSRLPFFWFGSFSASIKAQVFSVSQQELRFMSALDFQVPEAFDAFADANKDDSSAGSEDYVHIRIQQRNGRKSLTTVQGLKKKFSYNKILKDLKKEFCCNGNVVQDSELGQVIQLQGDQRKNVSNFLVQAGIVKKENVKLHGF